MNTDDDAAFLRTIIANREDDVPRLVYADYLDEQGREERAEFIRLQIKLARIRARVLELIEPVRQHQRAGAPNYGWNTPEGKRFQDEVAEPCRELAKRERKLYGWMKSADFGLPSDWSASIRGQGARNPRALIHRGFAFKAECSWADWLTHADAILAATPLERVELTTWPEWELGGGQYLRLVGRKHYYNIPIGRHEPGSVRHGLMMDLLAAEWPSIAFTLPRSGMHTWTGAAGTTNVNDQSNWSGGNVPQGDDYILID